MFWQQVASTGLVTFHKGGVYVATGGLEVDQGGVYSNSGVLINSGGAEVTGASSVRSVWSVWYEAT